MSKPVKQFYEFGPFRLIVPERLLLRAGEPVTLRSKVFDTLVALVQNSGHVIGKDELMRTVWPDTMVEEGNLTHNISVLRKVLGEGASEQRYIETVPGWGYRFVAPVRQGWDEGTALVVAEHTRSRIVIEEEEQDDAISDEAGKSDGHPLLAAILASDAHWWSRHRKLSTIAALLVVLVGTASYFWISNKSKPAGSVPAMTSIAVLPFKPLTADRDDEYLGLGVADTLITRLSRLRPLIVRPTTAVLKYTDPGQDPLAAGRQLGVQSILDGTIQRVGDRLRVTVRLVRVSDGAPLWAEQFDDNFTNLFAVQDSISEQVSQALMLELTEEQKVQLTKRYTENTEAYQLYLKGRYFWNKRTAEGVTKAVTYFQQAIDKDPRYALAYAGLADSYSMLGDKIGVPPNEYFAKANAAAMKALAIDDSLAEVHASLAYLQMRHGWDWASSGRELRRAIEISPSYATAHQWYSIYLELRGRPEEAIAEANRALELDPVALIINENLGTRLYYARQYDRAIEQLQKTIEIDPTFFEAHRILGQVYLQKGLYAQAIVEFQKAKQLENTPQALAALGYAYAAAGQSSQAQKIIAELEEQSKQSYVLPDNIARIYISLGDKDQALAWLEKAYEQRSDYLVFVKVDPAWDRLRADPRFVNLLRRIGLAP
jgi:TolB-like protein/DNA-binding winged helix-turn-helix (wHTH) protein/Flp pilus assembly protein TadD